MDRRSTYAQTFPDVTVDTYQMEQRMAYFPSGMPVNLYPGQVVTDRLHLGKPWINLDGVGLYDNSAPLHDAITCTFTTPDPLAYKFTTVSPYSNTPGNPANLADYDGMRSIFSTEGQFLGVDETGFKGNYVMMNKGDYNPNMTTAEVDKVALTNKGIDDSIIKNIEKQIEGFKTRPDYDGYITFAEATDWYRAGSGETLYADITKLDFSAIELSKVSASEFTYPNLSLTSLVSCIGICGLGYNPTIPNTSDALALSSWMNTQFKEGLTYGHIGLKRNTNGSIYAAPDEYDFGMHEDSFFRNVATKFGEAFAGKGTSFKIEFYGFINK